MFLTTPEGQVNITTFAEELDRAQKYLHENSPPSDDEDHNNYQQVIQE